MASPNFWTLTIFANRAEVRLNARWRASETVAGRLGPRSRLNFADLIRCYHGEALPNPTFGCVSSGRGDSPPGTFAGAAGVRSSADERAAA